MYSTDTDGGSGRRSAGAVLMALAMVVSMVAIGGIAAQPAAAQSGFPGDANDLQDNELLVDDDFQPGEINDSDLVFETIQGAVDEAESTNPGTKIYVRTGDYDESVVVDNELELIGQQDPNDEVRVVADQGSPALEIEADRIDASEMAFVGNDASAVLLTNGSSSDNVKSLDFVDNRVIADGGQIGFESQPMSFGEPYENPVNELRDNVFTVKNGENADTLVYIGGAAAGTGAQQPGAGLDPGEVSYLIEDNEFATDLFTTPGATGVSLHFEADQGIVTGNQFTADGDSGPYEAVVAGDSNEFTANLLDSGGFGAGLVLFDGSSDFLASQNTVENADGTGVVIGDQTEDVEIDGNLISDNAGNGVLATGVTTDLSITNNDIENNDGNGVDVTASTNVTVASNTGIVSNGGNGVIVSGSTNVDILGNDANDNTDTGIYVISSSDVLVEGNNAEENGIDGIWVQDTDGTQVLDNLVRENGFGHGIHALDSSGQLLIGSNTVEDHDDPAMSDPVAILLDNVEGASVEDNELLSNTEGIRVDGADTTVGIERNLIDGYDTGIAFEEYNTSDPSYAIYNELGVETGAVDIVNNESAHELEAILNYFGTGSSVASTHDIADFAELGGSGEVVYDPFLPDESPVDDSPARGVTSSSAIDTSGPSDTQEFAHELTLEGSGNGLGTNALTIAFPADVEGTVVEVFDDVPAGTQVLAYDAATDSYVPIASMPAEPVSALDAFLVTGLEGGEEATVTFEYTGSATPETKNLDEGYNFVGAPQKNNVSVAFSGTVSSEDSVVLHTFRDAEDQPDFTDTTTAQRNGDDLWFESTEDASGDSNFAVIGSDLDTATDTVSPYTGYWVFVDEDDTGNAEIGSVYPADGSAETEVVLLRTSQGF